MRIRTLTLVVAAILLGCFVSLSAQTPGRIETRTRLVAVFSDLQDQWFNALQKKDAAALDRLLSPDHEVWTPAHDGPVPREEWQAQAFAQNLKSFRLADMAVKAVREGVAVESFRAQITIAPKGSEVTQNFFVVNVWTNEKDVWRCTDSYVSPISEQPSVQIKPTGKD